jgi:prophage DNA circulation protein
MMAGEWDNLQVASFKPDDQISVHFCVSGIRKSGGNRLVKSTIPFRAGTRLDSTGRKERTWTVDTVWHNTLVEQGLLESPRIYPDRLNDMEKLCEAQATGTLNLPLERNLRVRVESYDRTVTLSMRDGETMTITFVEDNEDDQVTAEQASVKATIQTSVEEASFDAESTGGWSGGLEDLTEFASELQGAMNAPGDAWDGIRQKADRVKDACEKIGKTLTGDPDEAPLMAKLVDIADAAARAPSEGQGAPKSVTRTWPADTDLFSIAAEIGQPAVTLLVLNTALPDPGFIPAGTPVVVLAS